MLARFLRAQSPRARAGPDRPRASRRSALSRSARAAASAAAARAIASCAAPAAAVIAAEIAGALRTPGTSGALALELTVRRGVNGPPARSRTIGKRPPEAPSAWKPSRASTARSSRRVDGSRTISRTTAPSVIQEGVNCASQQVPAPPGVAKGAPTSRMYSTSTAFRSCRPTTRAIRKRRSLSPRNAGTLGPPGCPRENAEARRETAVPLEVERPAGLNLFRRSPP